MTGTRVLLFSHHFPTPDHPGAAGPWEFADALAATDNEVTVVTSAAHYMDSGFDAEFDGLWNRQSVADFEVVRVRTLSQYRGGVIARLLSYALYSVLAFVYALRHRETDAVVAGTPPPVHLPGAYLLSLLVGARFVLDVRDLYPETAVSLGVLRNRAVVWVYRRYERGFWRRADALIVPSEPMSDVIRAAGVPQKRIVVIHNAYNSTIPSPDTSDVSSTPAWDGEFVVVYAGGMGYAPDIPTVLDAAARLRNQPIRFVFLGSGERKATYEARCRHEGLDNCEFLSAVPRREVGTYLSRADACVHALPEGEIWEFALPNKVFDYMRYGTPVVFAGRGAIAKTLSEVECGIAVAPEDDAALADALERLSTEEAVRKNMADAAIQHMNETYPRERLVEALDSVIP